MTKRKAAGRKRGGHKSNQHIARFGIVRLLLALLLLLLSLVTVVPAPNYFLWRLSIPVIEGSIWLVLACIVLLAIPGWWRNITGRIAGGAGIIAIVLALLPLYQVVRSMDDVRAAISPFPPNDSSRAPFRFETLITGVKKPPALEPQAFDYIERDGKPLRLDLYHVLYNGEPLPVVLVIHGGAWRAGDRKQLARLNLHLAAKRYAVAAIDYRLAPEHPYPAAVEDVRAAIAYLKRNSDQLGIDPKRIVLLGRSAGGQIALLSAYTLRRDPAIRGVIAFYAPTDLHWAWTHPANPRVIDTRGVLRDYMGGSLDELDTQYDRASPLWHADAAPPTLLVHGARDPLVSPRNAERLMTALGVAERRAAYVRLPWATHGCDWFFRGPCGQISTWAVEAFLENTLLD